MRVCLRLSDSIRGIQKTEAVVSLSNLEQHAAFALFMLTGGRDVQGRIHKLLKKGEGRGVVDIYMSETCKEKTFQTKPDQEKKIFQTETRLEPEKNFYVTILALKIFKTAFNIRISIGYKDNF